MDEMNQNLPEEMEFLPEEEQTNFFDDSDVLTEETVSEESVSGPEAESEAVAVAEEAVVLPKRPFSPAAVRIFTILLTLVVLAAGVYFNKEIFMDLFDPYLDFLGSLPSLPF